MERYSPHLKDLDCRDAVSRACIMEILAGRGAGPNGDYVLLKLDHLGEKVLNERLPGIWSYPGRLLMLIRLNRSYSGSSYLSLPDGRYSH